MKKFVALLALIAVTGPALAVVQPVTQAYPNSPFTMTGTVTGYVDNKPGTVLTTTNTGGYIYARQDTLPWTQTIQGGYIFVRGDGNFDVILRGVPFSQTVHGAVTISGIPFSQTIHGAVTISGGALSTTSYVVYQGEFLWGVDLARVAFSQTVHGTVSFAANSTVGISGNGTTIYGASGYRLPVDIQNGASVIIVGAIPTIIDGNGTTVYLPSGYVLPSREAGNGTTIYGASGYNLPTAPRFDVAGNGSAFVAWSGSIMGDGKPAPNVITRKGMSRYTVNAARLNNANLSTTSIDAISAATASGSTLSLKSLTISASAACACSVYDDSGVGMFPALNFAANGGCNILDLEPGAFAATANRAIRVQCNTASPVSVAIEAWRVTP